MNFTKKMKYVLIVAIIACLISMIGTYAMQNGWGTIKVTHKTITLSELAGMIQANNVANNKNVDITFERNSSAKISFVVFEPKSANGKSVPGIVCTHGGCNTKEMQMPFYIELARRGFVVIAFDWAGNGRTDSAVDAACGGSQGMTAMAELIMSMKQVDETRVGITGHSWSNWGCTAAVRIENTTTEHNHIAAYANQALGLVANMFNKEMIEDGFFLALNICKYDEFEAAQGNVDYLNHARAKAAVATFYPNVNFSQPLQEGMIYTNNGGLGFIQDNGQRVLSGRESAITIYTPNTTHPGIHFSTETGTALIVKQFYAAFGTPNGASFIKSTSAVWPIVVCFQLLGLFGFFALLFPVVTLLLKTRVFSCLLRREEEEIAVYSLTSWKDWLPFIITIFALMIYQFGTYGRYFVMGETGLDPSIYLNQAPRGVGFWTMCCGFFTLMMLLLHYGMRRLTHRKDGVDLGNPFAPAAVDSFKRFFRGIVFAFAVVGIMYIPVYLAFFVFGADFRICTLAVMPEMPKHLLKALFKFLPLWLTFYIPSAIFNANTRFKELPEWGSTLVCALVNSLGLIIYIAYNYYCLFQKGALWFSGIGTPVLGGIIAWAIPPFLFFSAFSSRFILNRTNNNAWAAGFVNALLACLMLVASNGGWTVDYILPF